MAKSVVGLYDRQSDAQAAAHDLRNAGFSTDNLSMVTSASEQLSQRLVSAGIPQADAAIFADGINNGGAFLMLQAVSDDQAEQAADIMDRHNVVDIDTRRGGSTTRTSTTTSATTGSTASSAARTGGRYTSQYEGNDMVVPIIEEQIQVGKREVETGGVRVETHVEEIPVQEQVTLREEEVHVSRRPVNQAVDPSMFDQVQSGSFEVRETDEQAIVSKEARVVEEVVIGKEMTERTETIHDTVRRTDVDVEELTGTQRVSGTTEVSRTSSSTVGGTSGSTGNEGAIERGLSKAGNAVERATGIDLDRDQDVGRRDPSNNI